MGQPSSGQLRSMLITKIGIDGSARLGSEGSENDQLKMGNRHKLSGNMLRSPSPMRNLCTVESCTRPVHGHGLCDRHRYRARVMGSPAKELKPRPPRKMCTVPGCENKHSAKGYCGTHIYRFRRYGDPLVKKLWSPKPCQVEGCIQLAYCRGYCGKHAARVKTWGDPLGARKRSPCSVSECEKFAHTDGFCDKHLYRARKYGDPRIVRRTMGAGSVWNDGYRVIMCPDKTHPNAMTNGRILEHVWLMIQRLGRPLLPKENIHHKNGQRSDNRPENLELWSTKQPPGQRIADKIAFAKEILRLYEPSALAECAVAAE